MSTPPEPSSRPHSTLHASRFTLNVVVLAGGVGGAKLADGVAQLLPPERVTIIVNTGDDFQHLGLTICPDLDTVMYTLAGVANPEMGWGRTAESWRTMEEVGRLGGPDWFKLGDIDLATHLVRSHILANGSTLTEATQHLCRHLGIRATVLPMSNTPAPTMIETADNRLLPFQTWFVKERWQPAVKQVQLPADVRATPQVVRALERADLILIAPSNPFVSIEPILNVYPIRAMIADVPEVVAAVSPIVGGQALKGPAAKMMAEMGIEVSPAAIAGYYQDLIDVLVYDRQDAATPMTTGVESSLHLLPLDTVMNDRTGRVRLARQILEFIMEFDKS